MARALTNAMRGRSVHAALTSCLLAFSRRQDLAEGVIPLTQNDLSEMMGVFSYVWLEERIPTDHPLRSIRALADEALTALNARFDELYSPMGRPSIAPEMPLRATLLQAFFSVRSE